MALIIKGDMPTCCWDCDRDWETNCPLPESNEGYEEWKNVVNEVRHPDCPIIGEIPDKHGRLIDEAKLRERAYAIQRRDRISFTDALAMALIETETIVEETE